MGSQLFEFWGNDHAAVRLFWVSFEVVFVIVLSFVERFERF